ncbi:MULTISPECIES: sulfatase-like hydrolase/transferase [unclassified Streptomyces]|uniref:sulfatase-like hydrolase/transferase n=1 Tax=unclassified Streptomyces TaxID=2593676 RepID=UPI002ED2C693|nr:sulfatase-like hydrolase/transferase [Streptomyces sp. NBC_00891]WSY09326.1 sulfatase-like hydrolase/transferase [Streptomyces sp. NBC_00890]WSZ10948.1 sulfatase-like hydrolase/transferase [Streptomyces sp. NBC_00869]WSZ21548.1 sulfatase-like hydrolase/transferase [Streptomyces sp. NBC_00870]
MSELSTRPAGGAQAPPAGAPPQVIVVLTDQQRWDTAGVHGNRAGVTPEFDRIAREGTLFEQAVTSNPVCAPARSALQTGRYPTSAGVFRNGLPLPRDIPTLAGEFAAAGYATGYIGKWHLAGDENPDGPVPPALRGGYGSWLASDRLEFTSDAYRTVVYDEDGAPVRLPGYRSDALIDAAIRFVADHHDRPYLLFVSLLEPHHQNPTDDYPAPAGYRERYEGAWLPPDLAALSPGASQGGAHRHLGGYLGQIKRVDEGVGRLRDALRSLGTEENTVLAWTADHGSHFRTRNSEYKRSAHEASVRVPFAVTGPGFTGGGLVRQPVTTLDLMPTLLETAGIAVPDGVQGHSLLPLTGGGRDPGRPDSVFVQISEDRVGRAVRTSRWKYAVEAPHADAWNDADADSYTETELYDLAADPYELDNLAGLASHRAVADELRGELLAWLERIEGVKPAVERAAPRPSGQRRAESYPAGTPWEGVRFGHRPRG